jgi:hypothetical protein
VDPKQKVKDWRASRKVPGSECTLGGVAFCSLAAPLIPVSLAVGSLRSEKHAEMKSDGVKERNGKFSQSYTRFPYLQPKFSSPKC